MRVPLQGERQIAREPLPTPTVATNVPRGAGGVAANIDVSGAVQSLENVYTRSVQQFNQSSVREAESRMSELENRILYDPKTGIVSMRGKNALQARPLLEEEWKKGVGDIEKGLTNDIQREAFRNSAAVRYSSLSRTTSQHVVKEMDDYEVTTANALVALEETSAVAAAVPGASFESVSERASMSVARARAALADVADRRGLSDEARKSLLDKETSRIYAMTIARMIDNENDQAAQKMFDATKEFLQGDDLTTVENALQEGSVRAQSQRSADEILAKHGKDRKAAMAEVQKIKDAKLRDAVEQRVDHGISRLRQAEQEETESMYLSATNLIDANPGAQPRAVIPASVWQKLPANARAALENRAGDRVNDDQAWLRFLEMPYQKVAELSKAQFEMEYWAKLDNVHRAKAEAQWNAARTAGETGKLSAKMAADVTFKEQVDKTLRSMKFVPQDKPLSEMSPGDYQFYASFLDNVMREKELFESQKGKPATSTEIQDIINKRVKETIFVDSFFGTDAKRLPTMITRDELKRAYVPWDNIPEAERRELQKVVQDYALQRGHVFNLRGQSIRDAVEKLYAAQLANDYKIFRQILQEKF